MGIECHPGTQYLTGTRVMGIETGTRVPVPITSKETGNTIGILTDFSDFANRVSDQCFDARSVRGSELFGSLFVLTQHRSLIF